MNARSTDQTNQPATTKKQLARNIISKHALTLQLHFRLEVRFSCGGLVCSSPEGPRDDMGWFDLSLRKSHGDTADLLN
jgi:hypothetical protein